MNIRPPNFSPILLAAGVFALGGCGLGSGLAGLFSTDPQEEQYQKAAVLPPLEVPPDLTLNTDNTALRVPGVDDGTAVAAANAEGLAPPLEAAAAASGGGKAQLKRAEDGTLRIVLKEDFARAWREVGMGLDAAKLKIDDRDRSRGIYFIRYPVTRERERGFTGMFLFWRDLKETVETRFLVLVQAEGGNSNVLLFDEHEKLATSVVANEILTKLHQHLE